MGYKMSSLHFCTRQRVMTTIKDKIIICTTRRACTSRQNACMSTRTRTAVHKENATGLQNTISYRTQKIRFSGSNSEYSGQFLHEMSTSRWKSSVLFILGLGASCATFFIVMKIQVVDCQKSQENTNLKSKKVNTSLSHAIEKSEELLRRTKDEVGAPGLAIAVSVDGNEIWKTGFGFADVENRVPCTGETVMRIASISKSITMAIVAKLWEANKLDIDAPVTKYVKEWPEKTYAEEKATITTRQLLSHLGGIRHYDRKCGRTDAASGKTGAEKGKPGAKEEKSENQEKKNITSEFEFKEYHIKETYKSVASSLKLFKDDELCSLPGTEYLYSTHGYTLVSAVVEGASGKKFAALARQFFRELGMEHTYLEQNDLIIYNRARYYVKDKNGRLKNAPYVDNSYKWAGGGFISTVGDLIRFGNVMLYSYQRGSWDRGLPGYLQSETMDKIWSPVTNTKCMWDRDGGYYSHGWGVMPKISKYGQAKRRDFYVSHTGGAIGASSVLLVLPRPSGEETTAPEQSDQPAPRGVAVAILTNMQGVQLNHVSLEIAKLFQQVRS